MSEQTHKKDTKAKLRLIWRFLRGSKTMLLCSLIAILVSQLADMVSPQVIRATIDNAIGGQEASFPAFIMRLVDRIGGFGYIGQHLYIMALAIVAVAAVKALSQYFFRVCNSRGSETLIKTMRDSLFTHIEHLPFQWHMENKTGDIIQRCTSDIDMVRNFISEQMTSIIRIVGMLVLSLVFMFPMNAKLTWWALAPMPVIMWYSMRFHKTIGDQFRKCDESEGRLSAMVQENLTGVRVVRAFGRERYELDRFQEHNTSYTRLWEKLGLDMAKFWSLSDIMSGLQILLVVVLGAKYCIDGTLTSGEYVAFMSYNGMLCWPLRQLGRMIAELSKAGVSLDRVQYIMDSAEEVDQPGCTDAPMDGDISFEHVSFGYENCPEILHDINFTMKAGSTLGILGGTGSGKSTLMFLLDKLYDIPEGHGRITIGGWDIRTIRTEHLRNNIGIVLQEPFLFSRSIENNLKIAQPDMTLEEIREAAKAACLDETVTGFTKGYDTFVGERGVTLSGGQKQRAAIARMLAKPTPIMIFDDSLSAVDTETDAKIRSALEARFGSASIILISHRITTLSKADKILVLDRGRIVEQGTHAELSKGSGIYAKINSIQSGTIQEEEAAER